MSRKAAAAALAGLLAACCAAALHAEENGQAAFARQDYATAAELWTGEAARGSTEAKFGLGLISDLGLGAPRDTAKALRWYLEAAEEGMAEAQFNVGVMLDAGAGVPRNPGVGAVWYARAAANGHHRGQYDLGLLYEHGDGVPRNNDLARAWFEQAGETLPAAREHLRALRPADPADRRLAAPLPSAGALVAGRAEMVWSATPGPVGARYLVELARLPGEMDLSGEILLSRMVDASAISAPAAVGSGHFAWRVSLVDGAAGRYAASNWQPVGPGADTGPRSGIPNGRAIVRVSPEDGSANRLASELAMDFRAAGIWVRIVPAARPTAESGVRFRFADDAELAATMAGFLPPLGGKDIQLSPDLDLAPGEIEITLVGGPAAP